MTKTNLPELSQLISETGYTDISNIEGTLSEGHNNPELIKIINWFTTEFKKLEPSGSNIQIIPVHTSGQDFMFELRSFIEELGCPKSLIAAKHLEQPDSNYWNRVLLFLCSELQAAKLNVRNQQSKVSSLNKSPEDHIANQMKIMLIALGFSKPPPEITSVQLFNKIESKIKGILSTVGPSVLGQPLFNGVLTENQWKTLQKINDALCYDYNGRRQMLLKRLDVTVQSFSWSDQIKKMEDEIAKAFSAKRQKLNSESKISIADVLAAREDLILLTKTSGASDRKNTKCAINKFIIGKVPDRGGRPSEQRAPPPEMPSWQTRKEGGGGPGGRGGGGFRGRGDGGFRGRGGGRGSRGGGQRVQGGWSGGGHDNRGGGGGGGGRGRSRQY